MFRCTLQPHKQWLQSIYVTGPSKAPLKCNKFSRCGLYFRNQWHDFCWLQIHIKENRLRGVFLIWDLCIPRNIKVHLIGFYVCLLIQNEVIISGVVCQRLPITRKPCSIIYIEVQIAKRHVRIYQLTIYLAIQCNIKDPYSPTIFNDLTLLRTAYFT